MASKRMIASDIWRDQFFGGLDLFSRLLWMGLITTCADDQGRILYNPRLIKCDIFPLDDVTVEQIDQSVQKFVAAGKVILYTIQEQVYIQIKTWWEYQTPQWAMPSKYPAPENWKDRFRYHARGNVIITENWNEGGGIEQDGYLPSPLGSTQASEVGSWQPYPIDESKSKVESESRVVEGELSANLQKTATPPPFRGSVLGVYAEVTGQLTYPVGKENDVIRVIEPIFYKYGQDKKKTVDYLKPFFDWWISQRRQKDNLTYRKTNIGWLDFALAGELPDAKNKPRFKVDPNCKKCDGRGFLVPRIEDIHDPKFGKAIQCPECEKGSK